jgi:IS30 family transposase
MLQITRPPATTRRWSPGQISRWLRRRYPRKLAWHVCTETIYEAVYLWGSITGSGLGGQPGCDHR